MIISQNNARLFAYTIRGAWAVNLLDMRATELSGLAGQRVWLEPPTKADPRGRLVTNAERTPNATYVGAWALDCPMVLVAGDGPNSIDFSRTGPNGVVVHPDDVATVQKVAAFYACDPATAKQPVNPLPQGRPPGVIWDDRDQPPPPPPPPQPIVPDRGFRFPWWPVAVAVAFFALRGTKR